MCHVSSLLNQFSTRFSVLCLFSLPLHCSLYLFVSLPVTQNSSTAGPRISSKRPARQPTEGLHASAGTSVVQSVFIDKSGTPVVVTCFLQGYRGGLPFHGWHAKHDLLCVDACANFCGIVHFLCQKQPLHNTWLFMLVVVSNVLLYMYVCHSVRSICCFRFRAGCGALTNPEACVAGNWFANSVLLHQVRLDGLPGCS